MLASVLRPLARASSPALPRLAAAPRSFSLSAARLVRLPHQAPSPEVAFLEKFSPVNHKVELTADGEREPAAYKRFMPRNDFRKVAICLVIFAGIAYGIFLPADMPYLSETEYKGFPVEWVEVLGAPDAKEGRYKVLTLRLPDEHPMVKGNLKSESAPYHLMVKDPSLQIERVCPFAALTLPPSARADARCACCCPLPSPALHHLPAAAARDGLDDAAVAPRQEGGRRRGLALHPQPQAL